MADILHTLSMVSYILAVIFAIVAVTLWFVFKIPNIIGDLSGRNAKKSIARMRQNNERTGDKLYKTREKNIARGKLTGTMEGLNQSGNAKEETGLLNENLVRNYDTQATGLLVEEDKTTLLDELGNTASLEECQNIPSRAPSTVVIQMIEESMLIHTEEVI